MLYRALAAATCLAAAFLLDGCGKSAAKPPQPPTVSTAVAQSGTIYPNELLPGLIAPFQNVAISSTLVEPALQVNVAEGDRVRRGEILAVLDTTDLRAQMEADIAQAKSDAAGATHTSDQGLLTIQQSQQSVVNTQEALTQARQTLARDSLDLSRYQQLDAKGYIAQQQVDPIYAILHASGTQVASVAVGTPAKIVASDLGALGRNQTGRVAGVLNEVNPGSTDFQIKVLLRNPSGKLRPGMAIEGNVALPPLTGVKIPATAFLDDNHDTIMTVGDDSTVKTVKVQEAGNDGTVAVVSGIAPGTRVVSDGQTSVGDGEKVAVR